MVPEWYTGAWLKRRVESDGEEPSRVEWLPELASFSTKDSSIVYKDILLAVHNEVSSLLKAEGMKNLWPVKYRAFTASHMPAVLHVMLPNGKSQVCRLDGHPRPADFELNAVDVELVGQSALKAKAWRSSRYRSAVLSGYETTWCTCGCPSCGGRQNEADRSR